MSRKGLLRALFCIWARRTTETFIEAPADVVTAFLWQVMRVKMADAISNAYIADFATVWRGVGAAAADGLRIVWYLAKGTIGVQVVASHSKRLLYLKTTIVTESNPGETHEEEFKVP